MSHFNTTGVIQSNRAKNKAIRELHLMLKNSETAADQLVDVAYRKIFDLNKANELLTEESNVLRFENMALVNASRPSKKRYEPVDKKALQQMEIAVRHFQI